MSTLDQWKLRGPVREFRSEFAEWDIARDQWQDSRLWTAVRFRPDGQVSERQETNRGSVWTMKNHFDESGRLLESLFHMDSGASSKAVFRYDESGRPTQKIEVDQNGTERESEIFSFDRTGLKTKVTIVPKVEVAPSCGTFYGVEGSEGAYGAPGVAMITTFYDGRDNPREALFQDENRNLLLRVVLTRDDAQRVVKEEAIFGDRHPLPKNIEDSVTNEPMAAAILEQLFGPKNGFQTITYRYDDAGLQVERFYSMGDFGKERTTREYDEHGNPVHEIEERTSVDLHTDESGSLQHQDPKSFRSEVRYDYKYDSRGNWSERIVSVRYENNLDFQRSNIERREIVYY